MFSVRALFAWAPACEAAGLASVSKPRAPFKDVSVWHVRHDGAARFEAFRRNLAEADYAEFTNVRNAVSRERSLATRALLRAALSESVGGRVAPSDWAFERGAHGKPELRSGDSGPFFNCSHANDVSVIAISKLHPVGIDVEDPSLMSEDPDLVEEFFSSGERLALCHVPYCKRDMARARLWGLKESVVKMLGTGLALDVSKLEFEIEADRLKTSQAPEVNAPGMRLATWSIPNNSLSLSVALAVKN